MCLYVCVEMSAMSGRKPFEMFELKESRFDAYEDVKSICKIILNCRK